MFLTFVKGKAKEQRVKLKKCTFKESILRDFYYSALVLKMLTICIMFVGIRYMAYAHRIYRLFIIYTYNSTSHLYILKIFFLYVIIIYKTFKYYISIEIE